MKKLAFILAFLPLISIFSGCSTDESKITGNQQNATQTEVATVVPTDALTETPTEISNDDQTVEQTEKTDPAEDDVMNILMVGNSFCFYFCDELYGMLEAAGIQARVCNIYYSGCKLEQHWTWWKAGIANYDFIVHDENGKVKTEGTDLEYCLRQGNWDIITLQEGSAKMRRGMPASELAISAQYRQDLYGRFAELFPKAKLYWHQTWAYQVGFDRDNYQVDAAEQAAYHERQRTYALSVCEENGVERIPSGDAWKIVRDGGYDNLCARLAKDNGIGDFYHDGDIGGGQYLNACVWFETLTGQSCIGNTFRPDYELSEEMITMLQNAAHQAVEAR